MSEAMKEFSQFLSAKKVEKLIDLDPNEPHTDWDVLVAVAKVFKVELEKEKLQKQQLSNNSPMINGEEGNKFCSDCKTPFKKEDISIPKKARPKEAVLDKSKLEKKMAMSSQRVISNKSEYPEGMSREEVLRRERLPKRPKEIEEEYVMQKRVKRERKRVMRFEDSDSDSEEECLVKKTQKRSSKRSDPSLKIGGEEGNQYFSSQNAKNPVITKSEYPEGMSRGEIFRREKLLKRPVESDDKNIMPKRVKRGCRFEDSDYDNKEEELQVKKTPKRLSGKTTNNSKTEKKKNKDSCGIQEPEISDPPRELPEMFKSRIMAMGGKNFKLVITKKLTVSDCRNGEGRLSMPFSRINVFLFENEKIYLQGRNESNKKNGIKVKLIQPNLEEIDINLRQWDMPKKEKTNVSKMYVLVKPWNDVVQMNALVEGEEIQVWSFRVGKDELRLAIVRLSDGEEPADVGQLPYGEGTSNVGQLSYGEGPSNVGQLPNNEELADVGQSMRIESDCTGTSVNDQEPVDVGQLPYGEGTSNVGQLSYGEGPSNVGQLPNNEEMADVGQSMRIEGDCTGTSVNDEEPADVGQLQNGIERDYVGRLQNVFWSTHGKRRTR